MKKEFWKSVVGVILFMTAAVAVAAVGNLIQFAGRRELGSNNSFMFSGTAYRYNLFAYFLGAVLLVAFLVLAFLFYWKKRMEKKLMGGAEVAIYIVADVIFSLLMHVVFLAEDLVLLGITDSMRPKGLMELTVFSWPCITFVYLLVITILLKRGADKERAIASEVLIAPDEWPDEWNGEE